MAEVLTDYFWTLLTDELTEISMMVVVHLVVIILRST